MLAVVRVILRKAVYEWAWLDRHPKIKAFPESTKRDRWLTRAEADRLIAALPAHLAAMVALHWKRDCVSRMSQGWNGRRWIW